MNLSSLKAMLSSFSGLKIGLVGDLFLDRYLDIEPGVREISIETGLDAYQIQSVRNSPGALGTVMNNLAALGVGQLVPVTVIGDDGHGYDLLQSLSGMPVQRDFILRTGDRLTPTYTKPLQRNSDGEWVELNRLDVRTRGPLTETTISAVRDNLKQVFEQVDGLIVMDQVNEAEWGVVGSEVRNCLHELTIQQPDKLVFVDSRTRLGAFPFGILKGNDRELIDAAGIDQNQPEPFKVAAQRLTEKTKRPVFCTAGEQGMVVAFPDGTTVEVPPCPVEGPVDIVGAGDSATSGIVAALLSGGRAEQAAIVGNLVASITVQQLGTTGTATPQQVIDRWREING